MIYAGVARAFQHTNDAVANAQREKDVQGIATALAPINELLRRIRELEKAEERASGGIREIRRT